MTQQPKRFDFSCTSDDFKVAVSGHGVKVEIDPDGNVTVYSNGTVRTRAFEPVPAPAASVEALKIGAAMPDGSIYAGVSPATGKPMYATPKDSPLTLTFDQAAKHAANLNAHGRKDWRVPTKAELNELFKNRAAIGGFDTTGSGPAGWYWSSSRSNDDAWAQRFSDGRQDYSYARYIASALRCVRG